jgi:Domain of unknown function (DUF4291)
MERETALTLEPYRDQLARWPAEGQNILAHYDEASVIVYQAYRPAIGHYGARHGRFGGEFSFNRKSWIKPKRTQVRVIGSEAESHSAPSCCPPVGRKRRRAR